MKEHPSLPMRDNLYRSMVVGKTGSSVSYTQATFKLYWDSSSTPPGEDVDFDIQIFELDGSNNAARTVLDLNKEDVDSVSNGALIHSATLNLNQTETTDYILKGSYGPSEGEEELNTISWSYYDYGNMGTISQAVNLAAFAAGPPSTDVDIVQDANVSLTGKTGYTPDINGRYANVIVNSSGHGVSFRPGKGDATFDHTIFVWINMG